jgi:hypothetical protein
VHAVIASLQLMLTALQVVEPGSAAGGHDSYSFQACSRMLLAALLQLQYPGAAAFESPAAPQSIDDALWWAQQAAGGALALLAMSRALLEWVTSAIAAC